MVYSIDEGLSLMNKVAQMRAPVHGVYITVAPTKTAWQQLGDDGNYVVTPGQWSDMALSPCVVFGSISNYVDLFEETHGFVPNYNVAMSSFAGVVIQLAMQVKPLQPSECHCSYLIFPLLAFRPVSELVKPVIGFCM